MHIPDGFLDIKTSAVTNIVSFVFLIYAIKKVNRFIVPDRIPLMGVSAAFVFTIQLISFPVIGGTSVHILGSVLTAVLLGPLSAFLIVSSALILQALLFQHGGIISLGANIFNIAVTGCILGYLIYKIFPTNLLATISSWISIVIGAGFCVLELFLSGKINLKTGLIAMLSTHVIAGVIEATVTYLILSAIDKIKPDLRNITKL
ncbi:MAG: energy-coupling factor ABC transporter permease [Elusimicrobiota bacterium]